MVNASRAVYAVVFVLLLAMGCKPTSGSAPASVTAISLAAGTEVPLTLLRQIEAGDAREGLLVPFMVAADVKDSAGSVLISKGSVTEGEVTWSRSEGTLSGLMNQPARLAVKLKHTRGAGDVTVPLCADRDKPDEAYQFTRENTGKPWERDEFDSMDAGLNEAVARSLAEFMETGDASRLSADTQAREWLLQATRKPGLEAARAYLDPEAPERGQAEELERVVRHVRDGSITKLAGGEVMLAVTALQQFGKLAQSVEQSLSGKLKGRTIKAYVGTPVTAYVARDVQVKVSK